MARLPALPASVPLALLTRGAEPESVHRGAVAVVDAGGRLLASCGDPCWPVWLRSAAKPFQLVPFLASPGVSALRLSVREVAVAAASHGGEGLHLKTVEGLLARGGFSERDLSCGGHLPMDEASARELVRSGREPGALHNNCSGKHAAMLLACRLRGEDPRRYESPSHPHQRRILSYLSRATGTPERSIGVGVDGCAAPVFRLPLSALARGYARLPGRRLAEESAPEAAARRRVASAMVSEPWYVAGSGRFTTVVMEELRGDVVAKEGAEGVYALCVSARASRRGGWVGALGLAVKVEDGSIRARDAIVVEALRQLGVLRGRALGRLESFARPPVRNVRGDVVGGIETLFDLGRG